MLVMTDYDLYRYTQFFEERVRETDFRAISFVYVHDKGHVDLWRDLSNNEHSQYRKMMIDFILIRSNG